MSVWLSEYSALVTHCEKRWYFVHRVHILVEMKQGQCICPLSWSVHCNFTGEGKCNERGWACNPHPHQPGLILPSSLNVRQKAAVATLCTLWFRHWACADAILLTHIQRSQDILEVKLYMVTQQFWWRHRIIWKATLSFRWWPMLYYKLKRRILPRFGFLFWLSFSSPPPPPTHTHIHS